VPQKLHTCAREACPNQCPVKNKYCSPDCLAQSKINPQELKRVKTEERLVERFETYLKAHPAKTIKVAPTQRRSNNRKASSHEMVLLMSDAHFSERVDPETAMGLVYNENISQRRIEHMRDVVVRYKDLRVAAFPIRKLTVAVLGDMLSGDIHEELEVTNENTTPVALVRLAYILHGVFLSFVPEFEEVEVVFIPGNHPRTKVKPRFKQKTTVNFEYILGHFVAALAQDVYRVQVPKDMVYIHRVFNWRIGMTHGDGVKSNSFAGIPFYGMRQRREAVQALLRHLGQPQLDYLAMGHFHQPMTWEGCDSTIILNGAIKGGDEYSIGNYLSSNNPVQYLLTFHEKHGITDYSRINLKDVV
jgi:predicted phosphodiesterase